MPVPDTSPLMESFDGHGNQDIPLRFLATPPSKPRVGQVSQSAKRAPRVPSGVQSPWSGGRNPLETEDVRADGRPRTRVRSARSWTNSPADKDRLVEGTNLRELLTQTRYVTRNRKHRAMSLVPIQEEDPFQEIFAKLTSIWADEALENATDSNGRWWASLIKGGVVLILWIIAGSLPVATFFAKDGLGSTTLTKECHEQELGSHNLVNRCWDASCHDLLTDESLCSAIKCQGLCDSELGDQCPRTCERCMPTCVDESSWQNYAGDGCDSFHGEGDTPTELESTVNCDYDTVFAPYELGSCQEWVRRDNCTMNGSNWPKPTPRLLDRDTVRKFMDPSDGEFILESCPVCGRCSHDSSMDQDGDYPFMESVLIFMNEFLKVIIISVPMIYWGTFPTLEDFSLSLPFAGCAPLATMIFWLDFQALKYLTAAQYSVFFNFQIVLTAIAYRMFMKVKISWMQCFAIVLLTIGCLQVNVCEIQGSDFQLGGTNILWGLFYLVMQMLCTIIWNLICEVSVERFERFSGEHAIFFTAFYAMFTSVLLVLAVEWDDIVHKGRPLFDGWDQNTGILAAMLVLYDMSYVLVIERLSTVVAGMIATTSMVLTFVLDYFLLKSADITPSMWLACFSVLFSALLYHLGAAALEDQTRLSRVEAALSETTKDIALLHQSYHMKRMSKNENSGL